MVNCEKCGTAFKPQKGLKRYCSLQCRNSRSFSAEAVNQKRQKAISAHKRGAYSFRKTQLIDSDELCSYGCGELAKYRLGVKQVACCKDASNKCPAIRQKNTAGLKNAYTTGIRERKTGFSPEASERGRRTFVEILKQKPFSEWGKILKKKTIFEEQGGKCRKCGLSEWLEQPITLELEHIDGNRSNNDRWNLELLCPNCHSQTSTYKGRNNKTAKKRITAEKKIAALQEFNGNISAALTSLGLTPGAGHWKTMTLLWQSLNKE